MVAEEKKDDSGNGTCGIHGQQHDNDELEMIRHEDEDEDVEKRSSSSSASLLSDDSENHVFNVNAPTTNNATITANEPLDMQLDRPSEDALQHQQQQLLLLQPDSSNHPPAVLGVNEMQPQLQLQQRANHNIAVQQLLEQAAIAQQHQQQQTRFRQLSLNSLQLNLNAPGVILPPFTTPPPRHSLTREQALLASQIQQQQALLAREHAAALGTSAVVPVAVPSSHRTMATLEQQQHPIAGTAVMQQQAAVAPLGLTSITTDPIATAPLLTANNTTNIMVPIPHGPIPQTTIIPQYTPPIPPTWSPQLPTLSVQDQPLVPPIYNGINPNYPGAHLLNAHPPIFAVDNFLTPAECDFLIDAACDAFGPAPVVGKGIGEVSASRTSSTCYLAREDLPEYLRKVNLLTGKPVEHCELPQVGRYLPSQQYLQHFDAFDLQNEDGRRFAANGGQRTVTVLVYLNNVPHGGSTAFPNLNLQVQPQQGMALVFFPSTLDGLLDKMALHAALPAVDTKYVSQVWIRQGRYAGQPSKRLGVPMVGGLQERREAVMRERARVLQQMNM